MMPGGLEYDSRQSKSAVLRLTMLLSAGQVSSLVRDRAAAKDLGAFAKQLEGLDATPEQVRLACPVASWPSSCTH